MEMPGAAWRGSGDPDTWVIASAGAAVRPAGAVRQGFLRCGAADFVSLQTGVQAVNDAQQALLSHPLEDPGRCPVLRQRLPAGRGGADRR
jgi:hypothetical protein